MGDAQELQLSVTAHEAINETEPQNGHTNGPKRRRKLISWIRIGIYAVFVLAGQSSATLLCRLYYEKGGHSKWMGTLVQFVGFPVLFPYYLIPSKKNKNSITESPRTNSSSKPPSFLVRASVYTVLGILMAADCYLYSVGIMYLPVSTFSLICASQLGFNAFFSFFLNSQKFTFYIINSLVLLTVSSILLVVQSENKHTPNVSRGKYAIGFICTVGGSAGCGLVLSLTQFFFNRVLKSERFSVIMDVIVCQTLVASLVTLVGFFASGEWKGLTAEMNSYALGKVSYIMVLAWIAIACQLFSIGSVGLIFEVSALFSNSMNVLGLPIVPVLAVFFFHEKMDAIKVMALMLAIWGFISYAYQNYVDDYCTKKESQKATRENRALSLGEREINI